MMINCMGEVGRKNDITENKPLHILDAKPAENHNVFSACNETADSGMNSVFQSRGPNSVKKLSEGHMRLREFVFLPLEQKILPQAINISQHSENILRLLIMLKLLLMVILSSFDIFLKCFTSSRYIYTLD